MTKSTNVFPGYFLEAKCSLSHLKINRTDGGFWIPPLSLEATHHWTPPFMSTTGLINVLSALQRAIVDYFHPFHLKIIHGHLSILLLPVLLLVCCLIINQFHSR